MQGERGWRPCCSRQACLEHGRGGHHGDRTPAFTWEPPGSLLGVLGDSDRPNPCWWDRCGAGRVQGVVLDIERKLARARVVPIRPATEVESRRILSRIGIAIAPASRTFSPCNHPHRVAVPRHRPNHLCACAAAQGGPVAPVLHLSALQIDNVLELRCHSGHSAATHLCATPHGDAVEQAPRPVPRSSDWAWPTERRLHRGRAR